MIERGPSVRKLMLTIEPPSTQEHILTRTRGANKTQTPTQHKLSGEPVCVPLNASLQRLVISPLFLALSLLGKAGTSVGHGNGTYSKPLPRTFLARLFRPHIFRDKYLMFPVDSCRSTLAAATSEQVTRPRRSGDHHVHL